MSEHIPEGWAATIQPYNRYSQFGEDGYLKAVFDRIGVSEHPFCVDVGAADGILFSNVRQWLEQGWQGLLIESDEQRFQSLLVNSAKFEGRCVHAEVKATGKHSLDAILEAAGAPKEFDLLNIDIDGQDYFVWNSLLRFHPRVVVCEYDPKADPMFIPEADGDGQAGWNAITYVAAARGYLTLMRTHTNVICVRRDICEQFFTYEGKPIQGGQVAAPPAAACRELPVVPDEPAMLERNVNVTAVISVPRLGINANWHCTIQVLLSLGLKVQIVEGVFWGQCLTRGIQAAINDGADVILTIDYDSVFTPTQVVKLLQLLGDQEEYDCIVPVQTKRECNEVLFQADGDRDFNKPLTNIRTGHFGLTAFDARAFAKLPKPWLHDQPDPDGEWKDGRVDQDIHFWTQWRRAGLKLALANEVRIGHLEFVVSWATKDMRIFRQTLSDYRKAGQPAMCGGDLKVEML